ncbi:MAG: carbohydrate binding domain-containing protein [Lewinellaceae bacterium]|nr:carbohydrate binding domain-containing protein [Phaeodactylibacter sp.]MCB9036294.1 carbohydrate binding domain-containing protein [Lewinellaceae bacterium]
MRYLLSCSVIFLLQIHLPAQNFDGGFPFFLPYYDSSAQEFLPEFPAYTIGEAHRVSAGPGGQFLSGGGAVRFWGVNIVSGACFPEQDKAPAIAARMRKMGINLVRFHHLDNPNWGGANTSILLNGQNGTRQLNPVTLDRLDYFIAQLKRNGIFVNMNLNVSRTFQEADGVPGADSLPDFAKGVTLFDPWLVFLQKEYAEQLLGHVNPYTSLPLAEDPVLAMVEMNNENSLYGYWKEGRLRPFADGGALLRRHNEMLDSLWHAWLLDKYGNQENLAAAWNAGATQPGTGQVLSNGGFETGTVAWPWFLEVHEAAQASLSASSQNPYEGNYCARLQVDNVTGTDWHLQFKQSGFSLQKDSAYVLQFAARSSTPMNISVAAMRDNSPYTWYAGATFALTEEWQTFSFSFVSPEDNNGQGRITISPTREGILYFDAFSLSPPWKSGLAAGESLASGNVQRILWAERLLFTENRLADMAAFYLQLQAGHFADLAAYLRDNLGVQAPIAGTNALGGVSDASLHENLDYLDDHSYWDHPWFPGNAWDPYNWLIQNQPQLKDDYLSSIANICSGLQLADKPYTVSEYNHGAPNRFRTEMVHALAAYSAFHGVDGIMWFDYNGDSRWDGNFVNGFFSLHRDNSIMALFPAFAYAFRQGLIAEDDSPVEVQYSADWVYKSGKMDNQGRWGKFVPYDKRLALTHAIRTKSYQASAATDFTTLPAVESNPYTTKTGETSLDTEAGLLATATPRFAAITGFLEDAAGTTAGDLALVQASRFGSVSWLALSQAPLSRAQRSLLTLSTVQQNTGMVWDGTQTVHNNWGAGPTVQAPQALTLRLHIEADSLRVYPLSTIGEAGPPFTLQPVAPGYFEWGIDQEEYPTLWFGLEAMGGLVPAKDASGTGMLLRHYPNPLAEGPHHIEYQLAEGAVVELRVFNAQGQEVNRREEGWQVAGVHRTSFETGGLPAGSYLFSLAAMRKDGQLQGQQWGRVQVERF